MKASGIVKSIRLAALVMLLTSPVYAQAGDDGKSAAEIERAKAIEKDYKESLKRIPDAKANNDPWSGVRPAAETPKPRAKSTSASTKSSSTKSASAKSASAKSASAKSSPAKAAKGNGKPSVFDQ
jgi:hypothetical protein